MLVPYSFKTIHNYGLVTDKRTGHLVNLRLVAVLCRTESKPRYMIQVILPTHTEIRNFLTVGHNLPSRERNRAVRTITGSLIESHQVSYDKTTDELSSSAIQWVQETFTKDTNHKKPKNTTQEILRVIKAPTE